MRGGCAPCLRTGALRLWCRGCVGQSVDVWMCVPLKHVLLEMEYQCFSVEMRDRGCLCAIGCNLKHSICVICSFFMRVVFVSGCNAGRAYASMSLVYCLYTRVMSSLDWPNVVLVSGRRNLRWAILTLCLCFLCVA